MKRIRGQEPEVGPRDLEPTAGHWLTFFSGCLPSQQEARLWLLLRVLDPPLWNNKAGGGPFRIPPVVNKHSMSTRRVPDPVGQKGIWKTKP